MKHLASVAGVKEEGLGRPSPSPSIRALPPPPRATSPVRRLLRLVMQNFTSFHRRQCLASKESINCINYIFIEEESLRC